MKSKLNLQNLTAYIESESAVIIDGAKNQAIELARDNKPKAIQDTLKPYVTNIVDSFERLWYRIQTDIDSDSIIRSGEIDMDLNEKELTYHKDNLHEILTKIKYTREKLQNLISDFNWKIFFLLIVGGLILITMESWLNSSFFMLIPDLTLMQARVLSFVMYLLCFIVIQYFNNRINNAESMTVKRIFQVFKVVLFLSLFVYVAYMRTKYIHQGEFIWITFLGILMINLLFILSADYLNEHFPSLDQINAYMKSRKLQQELEVFQKQKDKIDTVIKNFHSTHTRLASSTHETLNQIEKNKQLLRLKCKEAISAFMQTNLSSRKDRATPDCFSERIDIQF